MVDREKERKIILCLFQPVLCHLKTVVHEKGLRVVSVLNMASLVAVFFVILNEGSRLPSPSVWDC